MQSTAPEARRPVDATDHLRWSRRQVLAGGATLGGVALGGCLGGGGDGGEGRPVLPTPVAGDPDAGVTVAVYLDFACPHCRTFHERVVPDLWSRYVEPGTVAYEHHDFPLPVDADVSWRAASAARSVQDRRDDATFFAYVGRLLAVQPDLGPDVYAREAAALGFDGPTTRRAAVEERYRPTVAADREAGVARGVRGTPTVFVDDVDVGAARGSLGVDAIAAVIEARR